jgi:hypothetical protein
MMAAWVYYRLLKVLKKSHGNLITAYSKSEADYNNLVRDYYKLLDSLSDKEVKDAIRHHQTN